ncbi:UDP-N-acetylmuramate:L-alanyl-gamma-D-glutamyl-meso-diaminopimelate ligase [Methylococcus sp. EFPC2]|uniref:UDP-N-acetylmuramate:L-alanyl-gamma-D-glutamyl- meso-diaminopimelate ligase n=1 Tax=Methylococcus sp. EFPC2 TaxID=2812648 RepID=UPI001966F1D5|nr:UDP-N-acetylmuramate:L-alanyl-gamma-D-glutamyl-meso-diaminopimelate ligase [Methylococcus sp. EFPC2]QSA96715.1 UDP-N-acetylmuramate:L-alanyl-gamma-D-glutamyl-meso-diaminopimelate ligase [Methylococcus sp. EFPC2]
MHIHILGICGTFMGGLALIARELGHQVTGSDQNVYPPMSTQLEEQGIRLYNGYDAQNLDSRPDLVIIGNALSRGNPEVEAVLNLGLAYTSGARWLYEALLKDRWVLAVAGTHGKTTTSGMLAWILEEAGRKPGFLIGGIPLNFGISARLGGSPYFVIEADEYDTAFFDKRSKFLHYRPRTAVLNNLEYDHADIFPDLASIQRQFHHLVRTIPGNGLIVSPDVDANLAETLRMGCWTGVEQTALDDEAGEAAWRARLLAGDGSHFEVWRDGQLTGTVLWTLTGRHNVRNALSAIAAAAHAGVAPDQACRALQRFQNVKRRLEVRAVIDDITLYDDFAHHPTAIATTLEGLRAKVGGQRIIAILEPRSNTMRLGVHADCLGASLQAADQAIVYQAPNLGWDVGQALEQTGNVSVFSSLDDIATRLASDARPGDHLVFMSNGSFGGLHGKVEEALRSRTAS